MADHVRTQIRDAVVTLVTGLTTTGTNVYASNMHELGSGRLPALAVYTDDERIVEGMTTGIRGSRLFTREVDVIIECAAAATADLNDTLDTITKEVETAIGAVTFSDLIDDIVPVETETELNGDGEKLVGIASMLFRVQTRTAEGSPDVAVA